ncbi:histidine phosphatase family protein [Corynebacterium uberis]|uniref:histidine phosphatase family protein n=1 Tax=Corynebacterium TaxID=1716 RepID=UPI001D09CE05|nr:MULTISPECIES: histidine phosphatase family protein [Corynebacterium]MCZ9309578.1 histidine phosphatase family protein [Corynebacterium sp. c6VSa_13]UDL73389.1 histidine phosphatase family protein [Corynebacterium uberis]UDL75732.1 histidine phosphatase family protein [Corynebacterium uberis]UDL77944.1 histidine phosphatase family protein [Corynebacterium uberis]UDL80228.1 histidine phosphatase family protein [Corynebacterium uberis]
MARRIILLRHGRTYSNVIRALDTRPPGAELTDEGREQARAVGRELAQLPAVELATITCSVALRAQQTAMLAAQTYHQQRGWAPRAVPVTVAPGLHEVNVGDLEMRTDAAAHTTYESLLRELIAANPAAAMPEGEDLAAVSQRARTALGAVAAGTSGDALVVSHGGFIRVAAALATGCDPDFAYSHPLTNCRFIILTPGTADFGRWGIERWGDDGAAGAYPAAPDSQ